MNPNAPDIAGLEDWVVAFCTIRFDLEQGQVVEECYPAGALSADEELDVAFSSFPDSMSSARTWKGVYDSVFFFRSRRRGTVQCSAEKSLTRSTSTLPFEADAPPPNNEDSTTQPLKVERNGRGKGAQRYLYGFVFNRQRHDASLKRGGEQKSVVLLSEWPFYCIFKPLIQFLGPWYFDAGVTALEQAAVQISQWPKPKFGSPMELRIGQTVLRAHFPPLHTLPPGAEASLDNFTSAMAPVSPSNQPVPQGVFHDVDLYGIFKGLLPQLWTLWELLLIGEPLIVISPTPSQCCEAVAGLMSLVAPLPCSIDFRPYFTIHDPDFRALSSTDGSLPPPPMLLGVTNLFFLKALKTFPHVLSVGTGSSSPAERNSVLLQQWLPSKASSPQSRFQRPIQIMKRFSPASLILRREGPLSLMNEHREALWTSHSPATKGDIVVLSRMVQAKPSLCLDGPTSVVNNDALRRHFLELTTNFLAPFGPYLRASTPQEGVSPFAGPPPLPPFDASAFLEGLAMRGPGKFLSKRSNTHWLNLYSQFLQGPNFMPWFQRRRVVAEQEQRRLWMDACTKADVCLFLRKMTEVEIVDSFHAVNRHIAMEAKALEGAGIDAEGCATLQKARNDLKVIFDFLPKDLQELMRLNPQLAASLENCVD